MINFAKRAAALALAGAMALSLTACCPKELASDLILKTATLLGFIEEDTGDEEESTDIYAPAGGEITFPDGLQDTSSHWDQQIVDGSLYVTFNSIANRNTEYFVAASDSVTVTAYATTESTGLLEFKVALWQLSEDRTTTSYVPGTTVYFTTGGDCYTCTITGLTPGKLYKANVSYDSAIYYITGGMRIDGIGSNDLLSVEGNE